MALIKSKSDIEILREAGKKLARVLKVASQAAKAGVRLIDLDRIIHQAILAENATPSFLGFDGFPNASCLSLNQQVVHGIPDERILQTGDLLGIDVGLWYAKLCVDAAVTVGIGEVSKEADRLLEVTQVALAAGIAAAKPFRRVGAISASVQAVAETSNLGIVRALTGHGVGHQVHEAPEVPNLGRSSDGMLLKPGMVLAIEPMLTLGSGEVSTQVDGWGVVTADGSLAAQFEHTVLITNHGPEILTCE